MARLARVEVFAADEIAVVHVMARTVADAVPGKAGRKSPSDGAERIRTQSHSQ